MGQLTMNNVQLTVALSVMLTHDTSPKGRGKKIHPRNLYRTLLALPLGELSAVTPTERAVGMTALGHPCWYGRVVGKFKIISKIPIAFIRE